MYMASPWPYIVARRARRCRSRSWSAACAARPAPGPPIPSAACATGPRRRAPRASPASSRSSRRPPRATRDDQPVAVALVRGWWCAGGRLYPRSSRPWPPRKPPICRRSPTRPAGHRRGSAVGTPSVPGPSGGAHPARRHPALRPLDHLGDSHGIERRPEGVMGMVNSGMPPTRNAGQRESASPSSCCATSASSTARASVPLWGSACRRPAPARRQRNRAVPANGHTVINGAGATPWCGMTSCSCPSPGTTPRAGWMSIFRMPEEHAPAGPRRRRDVFDIGSASWSAPQRAAPDVVIRNAIDSSQIQALSPTAQEIGTLGGLGDTNPHVDAALLSRSITRR